MSNCPRIMETFAVNADMKARAKNDRRVRALELIRQGCSDRRVSERMGISKDTVKCWRRLAGLPAGKDAE